MSQAEGTVCAQLFLQEGARRGTVVRKARPVRCSDGMRLGRAARARPCPALCIRVWLVSSEHWEATEGLQL